jgi:hypothetical protein
MTLFIILLFSSLGLFGVSLGMFSYHSNRWNYRQLKKWEKVCWIVWVVNMLVAVLSLIAFIRIVL